MSVSGGAVFRAIPEISEVIVGNRLQLSCDPSVPFDDAQYASEVAQFKTESGIVTTYTKNRGQRLFQHSREASGTDYFSLDDITSIRSWYSQSDYGTKPFVYVSRPVAGANSAGWGYTNNAFYCLFDEPVLDFPMQAPNWRNVNLSFSEAAPFVTAEAT